MDAMYINSHRGRTQTIQCANGQIPRSVYPALKISTKLLSEPYPLFRMVGRHQPKDLSLLKIKHLDSS
jgi:hypothetical protein